MLIFGIPAQTSLILHTLSSTTSIRLTQNSRIILTSIPILFCGFVEDVDYRTGPMKNLTVSLEADSAPQIQVSIMYIPLIIDNSGPRHGRDVVYEDLRQLCIWRDFPEKWWTYSDTFSSCRSEENQKPCVEKALQKAGIEGDLKTKLDGCLDSSFVTEGDSPLNIYKNDNTILQAERNFQVENNIQHFPSLGINHVLFNVI